MIKLALMALLVPAMALDRNADSEKDVRDLLAQGFSYLDQRDYSRAEPVFQKSLDLADSLHHTWGQAESLRGFGLIQNARGSFQEAERALNRAVELHSREIGDPLGLARARNDLAYTEWALGNRGAAGQLYQEALAGFEAAGERVERAKVLYNLAMMSPPAERRRGPVMAAAIDAANEVHDARLAGKSYHLWGDALFTLGDLRGAMEKLNQALTLITAPAGRGDRARVLISMGRVYSAHRRFETARGFYDQALAIHRELGDKQGMVYALANISATHQSIGNLAEAVHPAEEAIEVARQTGSPTLFSGALANLARLHLVKLEFETALDLLQESLSIYRDTAGDRLMSLSSAYARLGRPEEAVKAADSALELSVKLGNEDTTGRARYWRARALDALGRSSEAVADVREALAIREKLRAKVVPTDYLKRGYWDSPDLFDFALELYFRQGLLEEALAAAAQGEARAFIDLLAARSLEDEVRQTSGPAADPNSDQPGAEEPHIASLSNVPPPTVSDMRQIAGALETTILSYWVGKDSTFVWAIPPHGDIQAARAAVTAARLDELVSRAASSSLDGTSSSAIRTRGGTVLADGPGGAAARRELHRLLVEPVAKSLGNGPATRVIVVPHGALNRLSFASLTDAKGRYLIEGYTISYIPAVSALNYLGAAATVSPAPAPYLLIADPRIMPPGLDGGPLPALPGARRESASVAASVRNGNVTQLTGPAASELAVRRKLTAASVIHFATHGVLIDDRPFDSFLALGAGPSVDGEDGRLTVREIYDLKLNADLVVLSACRTAGGPMTGDGVVGLTRAFFYAGARSVMATLWDVADEPTLRLIDRFYFHRSKGASNSAALRAAQLDLLAALRKGQVGVETSLGRVTLAERPVFWSGFVVLGRP